MNIETLIEAHKAYIAVLEKELEEQPEEGRAAGKGAKSDKKASTKGKGAAGKEPEPEEPADVFDYESMTAQELYKECCKRGISSKCKERNRAYLTKVLKEDDAKGGNVPEEEGWEEEGSENPYEGKKASELYRMCVDRKIKTKQRLKAAEYIKLLEKADAEELKKAANDEPDDWGNDDEEDWEL